jgi:hypothetical protein
MRGNAAKAKPTTVETPGSFAIGAFAAAATQ